MQERKKEEKKLMKKISLFKTFGKPTKRNVLNLSVNNLKLLKIIGINSKKMM